jgi:hypothetical protein
MYVSQLELLQVAVLEHNTHVLPAIETPIHVDMLSQSFRHAAALATPVCRLAWSDFQLPEQYDDVILAV